LIAFISGRALARGGLWGECRKSVDAVGLRRRNEHQAKKGGAEAETQS